MVRGPGWMSEGEVPRVDRAWPQRRPKGLSNICRPHSYLCSRTLSRKTLDCGLCPAVSRSWTLKSVHNLGHFVPCTKCVKVFRCNDHYVRHLLEEHKIAGLTSVRYHKSSCTRLRSPTTKTSLSITKPSSTNLSLPNANITTTSLPLATGKFNRLDWFTNKPGKLFVLILCVIFRDQSHTVLLVLLSKNVKWESRTDESRWWWGCYGFLCELWRSYRVKNIKIIL